MLLSNALELADDTKFALVVLVAHDGSITAEWSQLPSNLEGIGAVEALKYALLSEAFDG